MSTLARQNRVARLSLRGKAAFVTGGASGIGLALGRAFARAGMKVMLADIEQKALDKAATELQGIGPELRTVLCDVSDRLALQRAAGEAFTAFERVHIVCNNAGVAVGGLMEQIAADDWDWVIGVNLMGVIYGIEAFLPHIKSHGEGGHIVSIASIAGMASTPQLGPYNATKAAVVSLSETLAAELSETNIGVSVVCPGGVRTAIADCARNRPPRFGPATVTPPGAASERAAQLAQLVRTGMHPREVAARVLTAIRRNELYVFTHGEYRERVADRFQLIRRAFDACSPSGIDVKRRSKTVYSGASRKSP